MRPSVTHAVWITHPCGKHQSFLAAIFIFLTAKSRRAPATLLANPLSLVGSPGWYMIDSFILVKVSPSGGADYRVRVVKTDHTRLAFSS